MSRTVKERLQDPLWWLDQLLHVLGAVPAVLAPWLGGWGLAVGAAVGLYVQGRAEWEQRPVESKFDFGADLFFATLGGVVWALLGNLQHLT